MFWAGLPLHNPSNLADDYEVADEIYRLSGGVIGNVSRVVNEAAVRAIEVGDERITKGLLRSLELQNIEAQLVAVATSIGRKSAI